MFQISKDRIHSGTERLLRGPKDLARWDKHITDCTFHDASQEHRMLFGRYLSELRPAAAQAIQIWDGEVNWNAKASGNAEQALEEQWMTYPAGPAAQPFFVALIRRYWLACDELNKHCSSASAVTPETFLLEWLLSEMPDEQNLIKVLACMPYWPIGMDDKGNWC